MPLVTLHNWMLKAQHNTSTITASIHSLGKSYT